ncbi:HEAT repeat [Trinorchestia longiramus]|nr:HEAT repeat [Trinorchestia longiramus]
MSTPVLLAQLHSLPDLLKSQKHAVRKEGLQLLLQILVNEQDLPEKLVKTLSKMGVMFTGQYTERDLRWLMRQVAATAASKHPSMPFMTASFKFMSKAHKNILSITPSVSRHYFLYLEVISSAWAGAVHHNRKVLSGCELSGNSSSSSQAPVVVTADDAQVLVDVLCQYFTLTVGSDDKTLKRRATSLMAPLWSDQDCVLAFSQALSSEEANIHNVVTGGHLLKYLREHNLPPLEAKVKQQLIQAYIKLLFQTKVKSVSFIFSSTTHEHHHVYDHNSLLSKQPPSLYVHSCSVLLRELTHADLQSTVMPAVHKSLLRNPEAVLSSLAGLATHCNLDLSQYLAELAKLLQAPLHHKEDTVRSDAVVVCGALAGQCSDADAVKLFVNALFDVYFGSDGKLTVTTHKVSVLQAVEACSTHSVGAGSVGPLLESVLSRWLRVVEAESHEGSLLQAMSLLQAWLQPTVPAKHVQLVADHMQKLISLKTWTTGVRGAYMRCLATCVRSDTAGTLAKKTVPATLKTMEKALTQHTQMPMLVEALSAASLLVALSAADCSLDSHVSAVFSSALDFSKGYFTGDKFLTAAPPEGLMELCSVIELLLAHHQNRVSEYEHTLLRCLSFCLCWRSGDGTDATGPSTAAAPAVRQKARNVVKKLASSLVGVHFAQELLVAFAKYLDSVKIEAGVAGGGGVPGGGRQEDVIGGGAAVSAASLDCGSSVVSPAGVQHFLSSLASSCLGHSVSERFQLALLALPVACSPHVECERRGLWPEFCKVLQVSVPDLIRKKRSAVTAMMTEGYTATPTNSRVVTELCRLEGAALYPAVIAYLVTVLDDPRLLDITEEDLAIYNTPEGKLYHQHLVDEAFELNLDTKHVKKTTKVYSHQEQVMMLEEKKAEIERKRKEGTLELTPKQKEVLKLQTEKEAAIKKRVSSIVEGVPTRLSLLRACIRGDRGTLAPSLVSLVPVLSRYLPSPAVGPAFVTFFVMLRSSVFPKDLASLGELLARTSVRVLGAPTWSLPSDWVTDDLPSAVKRTLTALHAATVPSGSEMMEDEMEDKFFSAPTFVYCFPLLEWLLTHLHEVCEGEDEGTNGQVAAQDEEEEEEDLDDGDEEDTPVSEREKVACMALQVLSEHMCMRGSGTEGSTPDLYHPKLLPLKDLLALVIKVIGSNGGRTHSMACGVLCEVCACGSGGTGCHKATSHEIATLLDTLTAPSASVREAALTGMEVLSSCLPEKSGPERLKVCHRLWVARHDQEDAVKLLADKLWAKIKMQVHEDICELVRQDLLQPVAEVRIAAAAALATLVADRKHLLKGTISSLITIYKEKTKMTPAKRDQYDRVVEEAIDHWEGRAGVGLAFGQLAPVVEEKQVVQLINFFVPEALGDRNREVASIMLEAATALINCHGKDSVNSLLPIFEKCLKSAPNHASFDTVRQSVIILMGLLAKHLDPTNPKIKPIVAKLVEALSTPSQSVQEAVASCLYPLVPAIRDDCPKLVAKLMTVLLESDKYGERKGAAYGLASLVKGMGILALKQLDIITRLTAAIQDKKNYKLREGSLFGLEQLCIMLGKLFEPYIVHVLPHLLLCFGDTNNHVRLAAKDTAKAVMSKLSAHGVKLVLPSLLAALDEDSWRTKRGSVELLGNMAYCAPKQLSSCLPSVVPRLIEVLSDSHQKVQHAGAQALKLIGSVIKNPEIQAIVPTLLSALKNPGRYTSTCLQTLLHTKFVHFIDAPSLALIMPVVERAFEDRSTETRKMSAQIIGNMYSLTDQKDLTPYLPAIIPGLKASLLDPVPKVRSVSARALGAMVKGMGESSFEELLPWLMQTLTSEASSVDRSGAAQGLAEVVGGLGPDKLHRLMPDIVATAERTDIAPHVKDGYIMMFIYLPSVFQDEFTPYIGQIIPPLLNALADETEFVRDTALRAGQRIVTLYSDTAIELLLPELESGLFNDNWRIRFSSIHLLGDLLYRISGVSGKMTTDSAHDDDNFGTEQSHNAIIDKLGEERRNRVLAGLYMSRSDVALLVRQSALHVWKVVVTNTPKTLREILPVLFTLLLGCLGSTSHDKRQVAARTLGELVRKLGERVLPEIIPILEQGLDSEDSDHRQGVCIGLREMMSSTSRDMVMCFTNNLVTTVRRALCDPDADVRAAAAQTFDALYGTIGQRALDDTLPPLLKLLKASEGEKSEQAQLQSEYALDGLKQVMAIKSKVVLPYLVPQLIAEPVNTEALSILASVAGDSLTRHLDKILPALVSAVNSQWKDGVTVRPEYEAALTHCHGVVLAVTDPAGVNIIIDELLRSTKHKDIGYARAAVSILVAFCSSTKADYNDHVSHLLRGLLQLFTSNDEATLQAAWAALNAVTKKLDATDQRTLVSDVRQAVKFAASDLKPGQLMPGFCLPKGIQPILPIYREAILNGEAELKEVASNALTEVIQITSSESLKLSVIHVTGPLIRILGDRFAPSVKVAVLNTIGLLLEKTGVMLKPFLPQLQTTFIKAIHDPHRGVRLRSGYALAHLVSIHLKPEPMFLELQTSVKAEEDVAVRETLIFCVRQLFVISGSKVPENVRKNILNVLVVYLENEHEGTRLVSAGAVAAILPYLTSAERKTVITSHCLDCSENKDWTVRHGHATALFAALNLASDALFQVVTEQQVVQSITTHLNSDRVPVLQSAAVAVGYLLLHRITNNETIPLDLLKPFAKLINNPNNDVKQSMCRSVQFLCESLPKKLNEGAQLPKDAAKLLIPSLVNGTKEKNQVVKSAAEMALVALLLMKDGDTGAQKIVSSLEGGVKEALTDCISRNLRRAVYYPVTESEIDATLLS